jgi:hypothetical protein
MVGAAHSRRKCCVFGVHFGMCVPEGGAYGNTRFILGDCAYQMKKPRIWPSVRMVSFCSVAIPSRAEEKEMDLLYVYSTRRSTQNFDPTGHF